MNNLKFVVCRSVWRNFMVMIFVCTNPNFSCSAVNSGLASDVLNFIQNRKSFPSWRLKSTEVGKKVIQGDSFPSIKKKWKLNQGHLKLGSRFSIFTGHRHRCYIQNIIVTIQYLKACKIIINGSKYSNKLLLDDFVHTHLPIFSCVSMEMERAA